MNLIEHLNSMGYQNVRTLPTGEVAGVLPYLFTGGLVVGLDDFGWRTRFCYETILEAKDALAEWDGAGDPPGNWIKQKPEDRHNPNWREM